MGVKRLLNGCIGSKKEDEVLTVLYRCWRRANKNGRRKSICVRCSEFEDESAGQEYYSSFFVSLKDDVGRLNMGVFSSDWLWFDCVEPFCERLITLLDVRGDGKTCEDIHAFVMAMHSLEGNSPCHSYPRADGVNRVFVLWLVCERLIGEQKLYGKGDEITHASVKATLAAAADAELATAGFQAVDYRNPLDGYLAFSLYRELKKHN